MRDVYWIETPLGGRLAIMARPRAGDWLEDEIARWQAQKISVIVSLLEPHEVSELGLEQEADLCRKQGIEFVSFPIADRGVPVSLPLARELVQHLAARIQRGDAVAIHCRAGIGRSSTIAACILACRGTDTETALHLIANARGLAVPDTDEQRGWVDLLRQALTIEDR